ncbi:MAG: 2-oxoacid:acceptor oxidoreductase family protein [Deltaproteobacteria bacterium]|nr:2-oxoacid:acceptor oxidoreductase family protein [Deltaproteobacteria bacterium]
MKFGKKKTSAAKAPKYPGLPFADDGSAAVVTMETAASEAAGAYPITPSTQMGEGWAGAVAQGKLNVNGRSLLFFEPEGEHAAAAVTAGMSMMGLRSTNFSSGQGIAYMHESLYAAVGKRLTYVLNVACRAMTKHALNVHAGHDDYHAIDDTGFFQLFAKDVQEVADLNLVSHRIAELSLTPGICAQDGFLTSHVIESARIPERELVKEYLGSPADVIESPTPAQRLVFGETRRRIPEMFDLDYPAMLGVVQNQDSYAQGVAAQRPFYFDHIVELTDRAFAEYAALTGRHYARAMGYRLDDAEYVIVGQGSVCANAEAVCDHLRASRGLKIGVLNLTMFRPFPDDWVSRLLRGKRAATVLERVDQPLAVDAPLLREIRSAMGKAIENQRASGEAPYPAVAACSAEEVPDFYSGCFGLGSRDLQPADIVAAVDNMLDGGKQRRQYYLGIDFVRPETRLPKLQIWQDQLLESYPQLGELALRPGEEIDLMPEGATSIRIHSVGGWGAITMGKNLAVTTCELLDLYVKANPKYGSEKKGQPTSFYATLAPEPIRLNCELHHVDIVLSPDPNVFHHANPLFGFAEEGGVFVIQSDLSPEDLWASLPVTAQIDIRTKSIEVYYLDAFKIASDEATDPGLRYRMQGAAFMGAFFHVAPMVKRAQLDEEQLMEGIRKQLQKKFGHLGERTVEDNLRVIRRGYEELRKLDYSKLHDSTSSQAAALPSIPAAMVRENMQDGIGDPGRFWEQVCHLCKTGEDGIADPFAAISAIPAATSSIRDMTDVRFEVPEFVADRCTGCSQCWVECPDAAIPGLVNGIDQVLEAAISRAAVQEEGDFQKLRQIVPHLTKEAHKLLTETPFTTFADTLSQAYDGVAERLGLDATPRRALDAQLAAVAAILAEFPLARTTPFFDVPEKKEAGSGGLLSITINPEACKGCNLCVAVCPEGALVTVKQDDENLAKLRRNWEFWQTLPDTHDRYINIPDLEEGIGVLSSLLLKKANYRSMTGGDGACMGCGEKTAIHLVLSTVNSLMLPRVEGFVCKLDELIAGLDAQARQILASDADLDAVSHDHPGHVDLPLDDAKQEQVDRITQMIHELKDLSWRYTEGPSGQGRAHTGFANSTGCSSVWGSTYPYNPYPFPWVNHLFQDAPSIAVGLFEGNMRKMADGFISVRRAELQLKEEYDPEKHEAFFSTFDWQEFSDEEFDLCPPIFAVGGDGAMFDIGFQNLSRVLASGKPIRVIVLDTQVYSNTGGQACTSGFMAQVSDMAEFGKAQHGKEETRKELALIAMAHRGSYVLQSSAALASHLIGGVLKGLRARRPAMFLLHCPCPPEHGIGDESAAAAAKMALESRAFPLLVFDPDEGESIAECLNLDGNPSPDESWPTVTLKYKNDAGEEESMSVPFTIADWAATESRFRKHIRPMPEDVDEEELLPFHEYVEATPEERASRRPFVYSFGEDQRLQRLLIADEIVELAEQRLSVWRELRELAGQKASPPVRELVEGEYEAEFEQKASALRTQYEARLEELKAAYRDTAADFLTRMESLGGPLAGTTAPAAAERALPPRALPAEPASAVEPAPAAPPAPAEEAPLGMGPYIDPAQCTTCDECTNLNDRMFVYDDARHAYIKDPKAGTFRELVMAAERCPASIIHPGTPLNPKEKNLKKWIKRAERFNT